MEEIFALHHVGVAVSDLEQAIAFYERSLGFKVVSGPCEDLVQQVRASFLRPTSQSSATVELICPLNSTSPVNSYLAKGIGTYHVCFEVGAIGEALAKLWQDGCVVISEPVPAIAFGGRRIAWCFTPTRQLVELLERHPIKPGELQ